MSSIVSGDEDNTQKGIEMRGRQQLEKDEGTPVLARGEYSEVSRPSRAVYDASGRTAVSIESLRRADASLLLAIALSR